MRTITTIHNVLAWSEMTDSQKTEAYMKNGDRVDVDLSDMFGVLRRFCSIFEIELRDYEVDYASSRYAVSDYGPYSYAMDGMSPNRLSRYMNNKLNRIWDRYSKKFVTITEASEQCSLTGFCEDYTILKPMVECLNFKKFDSWKSLINECLNGFFKACSDEYDYQCSEKYFGELAECNNWEFDEDTLELYRG